MCIPKKAAGTGVVGIGGAAEVRIARQTEIPAAQQTSAAHKPA